MDISDLSLTELRRLKSRVETEISRRTDTAKRDLLKKMQKMASEAGVSLDDLIGASPKIEVTKPGRKPGKAASTTSRKKGKVAPQYRHPEDASLLWTGRGRQPLWVAKWLADGKNIEDLRIPKE